MAELPRSWSGPFFFRPIDSLGGVSCPGDHLQKGEAHTILFYGPVWGSVGGASFGLCTLFEVSTSKSM